MPTYLYECPECGRFDKFQRISEPALEECPTCSSPVKRIITGGSILIKGAGSFKGGDWSGKKMVEDYYKRKERDEAEGTAVYHETT
ncbi:MAG: zinc ribbon domain-containing protein [Syntrophomonadaceae bacterium]|nr:zinc ribbon domain-containing protein [Syntrophomonadaceae bacterium]